MVEGKTISLREYIAQRDKFLSLHVALTVAEYAQADGDCSRRVLGPLVRQATEDAAAKWDRPLFPELVAAIDAVRLPVKA